MKSSSNYIYLIFCLAAAFAVYKYYFYDPTPPEEYSYDDNVRYPQLQICRNKNMSSSLNYLGPSLASNSSTDLVLCPGDTFGDLSSTYVTVEDCNLAMYHQGELIWSSNKLLSLDENMLCAVSLEKDGNLVVYKESETCFNPVGVFPTIWDIWESKTDFHPDKTELRIQGQQFQLIHTLQDGKERVFYAGESLREFWEHLGTPKQVAKEFLIKSHSDIDNIILRRNEYIGDLNGLHVILESNCQLQLKANNQTIWSFAAYLKPYKNCALSIQEENFIGIPRIPGSGAYHEHHYSGMNILPPHDYRVLQSNITLQGGQLFVIQTLEDGSEIVFYSEPGQDNGLKLKTELRQIASNNITISSKVILQRLEYIGDLDGLHLLLQENCHLILANGQQNLWKLQQNLNESFMECFVEFKRDGYIMFHRLKNNKDKDKDAPVQIFGKNPYDGGITPSQFQLLLENNTMILTLQYQHIAPKVYQATPNTNGTWYQVLSDNSSLIVNVNDSHDEILPQKGYLGHLNGVYAVLNERGNWILFNKTKIIWESGTTERYDSNFALILTREGNAAIFYKWDVTNKNYPIWSTQNITTENFVKQAELLVNNEGLWLIHSYTDGRVKKFKAQEGNNNFVVLNDVQDNFIIN